MDAVWDERAFGELLAASDFFVHLHKRCETGHAPVTFRVPMLLSAGKIVLSERSHPKDEAVYQDLVAFAPQEEIVRLHAAVAAERPARRAERMQRVQRDFEARFAPRNVFREASIAQDF